MAKKSSASLSVVPPVRLDSRSAPPKSFTVRQKEIWKQIINSKPVDWFNAANLPLLTGYINSITSYESLSRRVDALEAGEHMDLVDENRLYSMQERQARLMQSFATKIRLTQQSRYTPDKAGVHAGRASGQRPWDELE
jgi:hypothetical protein